MQENEIMDDAKYKEAVAAFEAFVTENAKLLNDRKIDIIRMRAGVYDPPLTLANIGALLGVKRQRVFSILKGTLAECDKQSVKRLMGYFGTLAEGRVVKELTPEQKKALARRKIKGIIALGEYKRPIQYMQVHNLAGVEPMVDHGKLAFKAGPEVTCRFLHEDYGIVSLGDYRICARCHAPKLTKDFWITKTGRPFQYCRECNKLNASARYHSKSGL